MNMLFSFRTLPSLMREDNEWRSPYYMLRGLALSVTEAKKFGPVKFYVDDFGAKLIEALHLDVEIISSLEEYNTKYPIEMYTISKLWVYREQTEPFMHLDFDAFPFVIDPELFKQRVFTMFPEHTGPGSMYHIVDKVVGSGCPSIPASWVKLIKETGSNNGIPYASNAGVYGVNDMAFNAQYCDEAIGFLEANVDYIRKQSIVDIKWINVAIEQFTINSLAWAQGFEPTYMFPVGRFQVWNESMPHLIAAEKQSVDLCKRVDELCTVDVSEALALWEAEQARVLG
jgi:hypothetical protein